MPLIDTHADIAGGCVIAKYFSNGANLKYNVSAMKTSRGKLSTLLNKVVLSDDWLWSESAIIDLVPYHLFIHHNSQNWFGFQLYLKV